MSEPEPESELKSEEPLSALDSAEAIMPMDALSLNPPPLLFARLPPFGMGLEERNISTINLIQITTIQTRTPAKNSQNSFSNHGAFRKASMMSSGVYRGTYDFFFHSSIIRTKSSNR